MMALDRAGETRRIDADGRLHVPSSTISAAEISDYLGREVPSWETLNLNPDRTYRLLRAPDELQRAADSFHGVPLLSKHVPITATAHRRDLVIGCVMNPKWDNPDLLAELIVWDGEAIESLQVKGEQGISAAYRYEVDMTPGTFRGQRHDGTMRRLEANHVAFVDQPRVPSAVVGDSAHATSSQHQRDLAAKYAPWLAHIKVGT